MNFIYSLGLDPYIINLILINILVTLFLIGIMPFIISINTPINSVEEIERKNNLAFGMSVAGFALGIAITMTGITNGEVSDNYYMEILLIASYGLIGILFMIISRTLLAKVVFPRLDFFQKIKQGNCAVALIDAANSIATALIIRSTMLWVDTTTSDGLIIVIIAFMFSQALFLMATLYRIKLYNFRTRGKLLINSFRENNVARALCFFGYKIGIAFAIIGAISLVPYNIMDVQATLIRWLILSFILIVLVSVLALIAEKIIFFRFSFVEEIDVNQNITLAIIDSIIYIAIGLIIANVIL
jgi:uncharacterized membrane protein YjfL (UPF0719 family)